MKTVVILAAILSGLAGPAAAGGYSLDNRPLVVFPNKSIHVSPYPMSKRAASVWESDFCWRDCTGQSAWRFETCAAGHGPEFCRAELDAADRACLRACRTRGGPLLNVTD
jgi:hypothetical protein